MILNDIAQSILSKLNQILDKLNNFSPGDAKESSVQSAITQATNAASYANSAKSNTATNNTASSTGTLSQKLSYIIDNMATYTQVNNTASFSSVSATTSTTNLITTLLTGVNYTYGGDNTWYFTCPYTGTIKLEGSLSITDNRSNSGNGNIHVYNDTLDGTTLNSVQVVSISDRDGATTNTGSALLNIQAGTKLRVTMGGPRYETQTLNYLRIYGVLQGSGFYPTT